MSQDRPGGLKWTYYDPDVLPAWVAEMDYPIAPPIAEALHKAVDQSLTGYFYPEAEQATSEAATGFWRDQLDWSVDPSSVFSAPDVIEGTRRAIQQLTAPGSPVVLHTPVYFPFFGMVGQTDRDLIEVVSPRDENGFHRLDYDGIDRAFADGAGCIVLCSPWNPTGRVFSADEIRHVVEIARKHGARVISDEIHAPITYPGHTHTPAAAIDPEVVVTITSASKTFDLPGLKSAQVVLTNREDRVKWAAFYTGDKVGVGTFGLIASTAAYGESLDWYHDTMAKLNSNRLTLNELMSEALPRVKATDIQGTYLAWLDFTEYDIVDPTRFLLENARVALTPGTPFGVGNSQHARLNFATTEERLIEIVERMAKALSDV